MVGLDPSLRLELRARNNRLWHLAFDGFGSVNTMCREVGLNPSEVGRLLNLKKSPWSRKDGGLNYTAKKLLEFSGLGEYELFDPTLYDKEIIPACTLIAEVSPTDVLSLSDVEEVLALPPAPEGAGNVTDKLYEVLGTLTQRESHILAMRFGLHGEKEFNLKEIGEYFNVTRERIRQIEGKALRKMRHPKRSYALKKLIEARLDTLPE